MENDYVKEQIQEWYRLYSQDIYQYALFMTGDHERSKDIMQDTFLRAFNHYASFEGESVRPWLFRIARNTTIDFFRKNKTSAFYTTS